MHADLLCKIHTPDFPAARLFRDSAALSPDEIGRLASAALLGEVWASPKPGLVDRENNGSHHDMTYQNFVDSALALTGCFTQCARAGAAYAAAGRRRSENMSVSGRSPQPFEDMPASSPQRSCDVPADGPQHSEDMPADGFEAQATLAAQLRTIGLTGETAMYRATGGVNTHKGAVFSMGILCAAAASLHQTEDAETLKFLQTTAASIAAALLADDPAELTNGKRALQQTGTGGIRTEALTGFDTAFSVGLPALITALEAGRNLNDAMVYTLLRIIAATEDSNLVHRGGVEGMDFAKKEALRLTEKGPAAMDLAAVGETDRKFIEKNLSPGGSADLLALTLFLCFLKNPAALTSEIKGEFL